jgi:hypothetical protein
LLGFVLPSYPIVNYPSRPSSIITMYPVIRLLAGGETAVHCREHESREVSVKVRIGAEGTLIAQIVSGLDFGPSPIRLTAVTEIL